MVGGRKTHSGTTKQEEVSGGERRSRMQKRIYAFALELVTSGLYADPTPTFDGRLQTDVAWFQDLGTALQSATRPKCVHGRQLWWFGLVPQFVVCYCQPGSI